ncbi:hypothetical protein [Mameliella sediminis]|uniref:hypothetical protein n=1 Tax=Mameliella sediminis TaxID=2836866 RepID=UPI001C4808D4|nr:hypothetical protein [Mameliella sediminis]MBY6112988.1 hypothetical protein [Antarctobacter heliothermus]MBY6143664.1 hypothetical protein [Mameliella alba]MBV7394270.1 hypothetical protein [Mameliella sediminis]MBY6162318.1 hypothetical protein [Mameliella alba]MBY6170792.1 hypothetical protein [Mameliella alba]
MRASVIRGGILLCVGLALAGCGDPLSEVPRYSDVPVAEDAGQADVLPPETPRTPATAPAPKRGLLGLFGAKAAAAKGEVPDPGATEAADPVELAEVSAPARARPPRRGAPDAREVPFGATLPYGALARVCDAPRRKLGKKVEGYPERGSKFVLYDSAPASTGPRSFYLTGFSDGCARQFTAALVIFGSPESYEQIHYGPSGEALPVSETDEAYEKLKRRVCGVRKGKPCGSKMNRLARNTVFVSVYERFGSNPRWKNILLHDGEVLAMDMKG